MIAELDQLIPPTTYQPFFQGRTLEYTQPLIDLGFLDIHQAEDPVALVTALQAFRIEYRELDWLKPASETFYDAAPTAEAPDSLELKLMHLLVDMDGDFRVTEIPLDGTKNLISRVIHYRLAVLGFWAEGRVGDAFTLDRFKIATASLRTWIPRELTDLQWINILGDVPDLIKLVHDYGQLDQRIVCFTYRPNAAFSGAFQKEIGKENAVTVSEETAVIEEVVYKMAVLPPPPLAMRPIITATSRRQRRRQGKADQLREQITGMVKQMKESLNEQLVANDQFAPKISLLGRKIEQQQKGLLHLQQDLKELRIELDVEQQQQKECKNLRQEAKKIECQLDKNRDYRTELTIQMNFQQQLLDKQAQAPGDKAHRFDRAIDSANEKVEALKKMTGSLDRLITLAVRLSQFQQNEGATAATKIEIVEKKASINNEKKVIEATTATLKKLQERQANQVEEFDEITSKRQRETKALYQKYKRLLVRIEKLPGRFRRELKAYLDPVFYQKVRSLILDRSDDHFFNHLKKERYNQFLIRLIQVHQWTNGYYNGLLDSDLGKRTFNSIREIDEDIDSLKLRYVLYQLDATKGTWLLNVKYLFAEMMDSLDSFNSADEFADVIAHYEAGIENNPKLRKQRARIDQQWEKSVNETRRDLKNNKLRRVYFGVKSLARSVVRGIGRIIRLIVNGVKFLFRLLRNFILLLYREIREGLHNFAQGIRFLFGKRHITTLGATGGPVLITRFDFDCDVITMQLPNSYAFIPNHCHTCQQITNNLAFSLAVTGQIIEWTMRAMTLGWATILIRIALYFKKQVKAFLRRNIIGSAVKVLT